VLDSELVSFIESGCGLIVAAVGADGEPFAARAWGADVVDAATGLVRVLLDADERLLAHLESTGVIAFTGADVRTLRSAQLKGRVMSIEPATASDTARAARYCDEFFVVLKEVEGTPRELLDRIVPAALVACSVVVGEAFDQTPGPRAGRSVGGG
jgi:hypothetical protein